MKNIKKYKDFTNEEVNWKNLLAGAISLLATACSNVEVYDKNGNEIDVSNYESSGKIDKIDILKHSHSPKFHRQPTITGYRYSVIDDKGNKVIIDLEDDIISVGDSVNISIGNNDAKLIMKEEDCKDPSKCFPLPHTHIIGTNRQNPEK